VHGYHDQGERERERERERDGQKYRRREIDRDTDRDRDRQKDRKRMRERESTEIPTIVDPNATINYPSATGSIFVGIIVAYVRRGKRTHTGQLCMDSTGLRCKDLMLSSDVHGTSVPKTISALILRKTRVSHTIHVM
jgi:hypothetical protein